MVRWEESVSEGLVSLYLPGGPRGFEPPRRRWPLAEAALRRAPDDPVGSLRSAGLSAEAALMEDPGLRAWARETLARGAALSAACEGFPARWVAALGASCPPALWVAGRMPRGAFVGGVGSRRPPQAAESFLRELGGEAARLGYVGVSGAAEGCDAAFAEGLVGAGGAMLEILPRGLTAEDADAAACRISAAAPGQPFSVPSAMERNALIFALAESTVVGAARLGHGGGWTGATEALRRRLGRVAVRWDPTDAALRALAALGAFPLREPAELPLALIHAGPQPPLPMLAG
ncbi:MAG: DNA-processing protein DprA [Fimbriimonadales bacterium]|nr:DNA-processing protein DprA [Fimbriimonadales bacterium]